MKVVKAVTDFRVLMYLASKLGKARLKGNPLEIDACKKEHDEYRDLCLKSDEMATGLTAGELGR